LHYCLIISSNPYYSNSSERVRKLLISALNTNVPINERQFINAARSLIPKIQAVVNKLGKILEISCAIHSSTYNAIIAAEAASGA
jgi:hypothetical protein